MSVQQPLKWHGGKFYLADRILSLIPEHTHYVEPYFGGGAVFFRKPITLIEGHSEVINDAYSYLMNFWTVLQSPLLMQELQKALELTPFSEQVWNSAKNNPDGFDVVKAARDFFIRYRQSRQGLGSDFATLSKNRTRRGMNEQVSSWLSAIDSLPEAHARLQRVVITCKDALQVIASEDSSNTFLYLDPPYLQATRQTKTTYAHEMSTEDHVRLLQALGNVKGKFLLSGYPSAIYDTYAEKYGWFRQEIPIDNKASAKKVKDIKTECLWANFEIPETSE